MILTMLVVVAIAMLVHHTYALELDSVVQAKPSVEADGLNEAKITGTWHRHDPEPLSKG